MAEAPRERSIPFLEAKESNRIGDLAPGDYQMRVKSDVLPTDYSFQIRLDRVDSADGSVNIKMSPGFTNKSFILRPLPIYAGWRYPLQYANQIATQPNWTLFSSKSSSEAISG
ncbi:hypothetical protein OAE97_00250 [Verrucomicrobia bacterium]|jgi:hypothetical protein|nr:hypothetical protein [Verrucomicrobiota bacterium]